MSPQLEWAAGLFAGVVITAALVNRLVPLQRTRVRRIAILFVLYVLAIGAALSLRQLAPRWADNADVVVEITRALVLVNIVGTLVFSVLLRLIRLAVPTIASDLVIGLAYIVVTVVVLSQHGLDPVGAAATGAVVSAVIAISMQSTLGNILGGVALQLDGSIHEGDWIQLENGKQGKIRAIRWRHTLVETRDWSTIVVPNASLLAGNITILGKREGALGPQRMWVWFNVDFRFPSTRVIKTVIDAVLAAPIENVSETPTPSCVCMDFARDGRDSFASYAVRYWIKDLATDDPTNSRVRARIQAALRRANIPLAIPAQATLVELHDKEHDQRHVERLRKGHLAALHSVPLFQTLENAELETLADGLHLAPFTAGEIVTRQGAVAHWLYILIAGTCEVRTKVDPDGAGPLPEISHTVATLDAPDFFGEMGLMTGAPRAADVIAITDVECLRLDKPTFERVLLRRPQIAEELAGKLATRRLQLIAVRDGLDDEVRDARHASEAAHILGSIRQFFCL